MKKFGAHESLYGTLEHDRKYSINYIVHKPKHSFNSAIVEDSTLAWLVLIVASCDTMYLSIVGTHLVT